MQEASCSPVAKIRTSADSSQPERASLQRYCSASSAHGTAHTEAQRLGCFLVLPPQTSQLDSERGWCLLGFFPIHALKMRTSPVTSQPERASLESCCSASSAHGTARTEAQRLGVLACLANSNIQHMLITGKIPLWIISQPYFKNANVSRYLAGRKS